MASMYIARLGRFVFYQMKTDVYTHEQYSNYIHPCRKTSRFIKGKFRAAGKATMIQVFLHCHMRPFYRLTHFQASSLYCSQSSKKMNNSSK